MKYIHLYVSTLYFHGYQPTHQERGGAEEAAAREVGSWDPTKSDTNVLILTCVYVLHSGCVYIKIEICSICTVYVFVCICTCVVTYYAFINACATYI